jgi:hypothetical protein
LTPSVGAETLEMVSWPLRYPEPEPEPPPPTDICNDGLDNEGEPGLIDGDDPNCQ